MSQKDIQIEHKWNLVYGKSGSRTIATYSNSFVNDLIHGVKFDILCGLSAIDKCVVVLSKTPCTPANATFKMIINSDKYEEDHIDCWINSHAIKYNLEINPNNHSITYEFKCIIMWHGFEESVPDGIHANLKNLLTSSDLSDMVIVIGENKIPVHKTILAAYSPVFFAMFKANMSESVNKQITVTDIEVDVMEKIINFMYTGVIHPVPEICDLLSILQVADKYEIMALKTFCERKVVENLDLKNVLKILEIASQCRVPQLIKTVISFMVKHKSAIMKLEELEDMHCRKPEILLEFVIRSIATD